MKKNESDKQPVFFKTSNAFRKWLEKNYDKATELIVGYYKVNSGTQSITWSESVDQALCFGWIDGVRTSIDKERYQIRFTPRKHNSIWSAANIKKVAQLTEQGLMQVAGLASFEKRSESKSAIYSFEKEDVKFSPSLEKLFKANKTGWKYFENLASSYRKASSNWVMSAKQESTQLKRLKELIDDSAAGTNKWKDNKYKTK